MSERDKLRTIHPEGWARPVGYANGILVPAGHCLLAVAGQVGWDADSRMVSEEFVPQFAQALGNVVAIVRAAGGEPEHLIRLTFFVTDKNQYVQQTRQVGQHYREIVGRHYPACTLVEVRALLEPGALIEIEATAALPPEH